VSAGPRRPVARRAARLLLALAALTACGGQGAEPAPPRELPPLVRLGRPPQGLVPRVIDEPSAAEPDTLLWRTVFDGRDGRAWHALVDAPPGEEGLRYEPVALDFGPLLLRRGSGWAAATSLPVRGGQALSVRVAARLTDGAQAPEVPVLALLELREPPDFSAPVAPSDVAGLVDARRHACHVLQGELSSASRTLEARFVTERATTELGLYLLAPPGEALPTAVVEVIELRALPLARHVAGGGEFPRLQRLEGGPLPLVRVALDRDEREGLLALPGRRIEWPLPPCALAQRLELSLGVAPRDPLLAGAVRLTVTLQAPGAAAVTLLERRRTAPAVPEESAWEDVAAELPPLPAGATLSLACAAEGDDPPLTVFGHPTLSRAPAERRPNVVLISLDTLRPDRLGCYGGDPALTPRLDGLAAQGLRFAQAYGTSSYTLPSHASLLTGQWPAVHGAEDVADRLDRVHSPFLARLLAEAGWVTAAFTGGGYVSPEYGFAEGFDRYAINDPVWALDTDRGRQLLTTMSWERAPMDPALLARYAAPAVERWIEARAGGPPFFLFLHTYVVHNYAPDLPALQAHGLLEPDGRQRPFNHQDRTAFNAGSAAGEPERARVVQQYLPWYDATVGMADAFTGRVLDALERAGLARDTLVLVTSDHGEEFGEHGFFGHGETLFEPAVRVPLLARLPDGASGPPPGSVAQAPVSLADVAPWILRLCGLVPDPRMLVGPPLGPDTLSPPGREQLFLELDTHRAHLSAVRQGPLKLHELLTGRTYGLQPGQSRLHDLASDPQEQHDLSAAAPADAQRLLQRLQQFLELTGALQPRGADTPLDLDSISPEMLQTLKALGYAEFLQGR